MQVRWIKIIQSRSSQLARIPRLGHSDPPVGNQNAHTTSRSELHHLLIMTGILDPYEIKNICENDGSFT